LVAFFSLSGIASTQLGLLSSEAASSEATSAIRYQRSERIGFAAHVVTELKFTDIEREIGFAHLMVVANDAAPISDQKPSIC
jgi:hypothetical protein